MVSPPEAQQPGVQSPPHRSGSPDGLPSSELGSPSNAPDAPKEGLFVLPDWQRQPGRWTEQETVLLKIMRNNLEEEIAGATQFPEVVGDRKLIRYLRGNKHDVDISTTKYRNMLKWRKENGVDAIRQRILDEKLFTPNLFPMGQEILSFYPVVVSSPLCYDKDGRPVCYESYDFSPSAALETLGDLDNFVLFHIYCEELHQMVLDSVSDDWERKVLAQRQVTQELDGQPEDPTRLTSVNSSANSTPSLGSKKFLAGSESLRTVGEEPWGQCVRQVMIRDLRGFSLEHAGPIARELIGRVVNVSSDNYPEQMECCFLINVPWVFFALWKAMKPMLTPQTVAKVKVLDARGYSTMLEFIPNAQMPRAVGGPVDPTNCLESQFDALVKKGLFGAAGLSEVMAATQVNDQQDGDQAPGEVEIKQVPPQGGGVDAEFPSEETQTNNKVGSKVPSVFKPRAIGHIIGALRKTSEDVHSHSQGNSRRASDEGSVSGSSIHKISNVLVGGLSSLAADGTAIAGVAKSPITWIKGIGKRGSTEGGSLTSIGGSTGTGTVVTGGGDGFSSDEDEGERLSPMNESKKSTTGLESDVTSTWSTVYDGSQVNQALALSLQRKAQVRAEADARLQQTASGGGVPPQRSTSNGSLFRLGGQWKNNKDSHPQLHIGASDLTTWVPNADRSGCLHCERPFTVLRRRHHCRMCGELVCGECSPRRVRLGLDGSEALSDLSFTIWRKGIKSLPVRVCTDCYISLQSVRIASDLDILVPAEPHTTPVSPENLHANLQPGASLNPAMPLLRDRNIRVPATEGVIDLTALPVYAEPREIEDGDEAEDEASVYDVSVWQVWEGGRIKARWSVCASSLRVLFWEAIAFYSSLPSKVSGKSNTGRRPSIISVLRSSVGVDPKLAKTKSVKTSSSTSVSERYDAGGEVFSPFEVIEFDALLWIPWMAVLVGILSCVAHGVGGAMFFTEI